MPRWMTVIVMAGAVWLGTGTAHAGVLAHCYGPFTLNSNNYAPDSVGMDVADWTGDFTVNLGVTSGTLTVAVEGQLAGGTFASLGSVTTTSLAQFHGPLSRLRFSVSSCSSCLATIVACANGNGP